MTLNNLIIALAILFGSFALYAQEENTAEESKDPLANLSYKKKLKFADNAFEYGNYFQALDLYKSLLDERPGNNQLYYKIAYCYMEARDYKSSEAYFTKAIEAGNTESKTYYYKALMQNMQGKYDAAKNTYAEVVKKAEEPWMNIAREKIEACAFAAQTKEEPVNYQITHLEPPVNGPFTEYSPKVYSNKLYYSSLNTDTILNQEFYRKNKKHYSRIYASSKVGDSWAQGKPLSRPFNGSDFHSGNFSINTAGNRAYFTKCQDEGNANITCKIYQSTKMNGGWTEAVELSGGVNEAKVNNTHPTVAEGSGDYDILYFSSDREDGAGGYDIYYAEVGNNGSVKNVTNVGPVINTKYNEKTPFYYKKDSVLFFSSDGHFGLGGFDNFKAEGQLNQWNAPENLGYPINSSADDQYYASGENKKIFYFVSNRPGIIGLKSETCCDDIFQAKDLFVPVFAISGDLLEQVDSVTTSPLKGVTVAVYDLSSGSRSLVVLDSLGQKTQFSYPLKVDKKYEVEFKKQGFFTANESINTLGLEESDTFSVDVSLEKIRKDKSYSLSNIYYAYNSAELNEGSKKTLDQLYTILADNESLIFELSSHTDSIGSKGYNERLSQKRADACVNYLKEKGIPDEQLIAKGYGESQPIAPNTNPDGTDNPEGRAKNRRTEYKVIGELEYEGDEIIFEQ